MSEVAHIFEEGGERPNIIDRDLTPTPTVPPGVPVRLTRATSSLWRVIDRTGRVIGHLQTIPQAEGVRFRARRFHAASRAFLELGDFWNAGEAIDCLRFAR